MKKLLLLLFVTNGLTIGLFAQAVGINTDGSSPNASSILDIKSSSKGLLIPRMTTAQRTAIAAPAIGLMVFDTDTKSFWYYDGASWINNSVGWSLNGNAGIDSSRFIGTLNYFPLFFRVNNELSGEIGTDDGNTAFGLRTLQHNDGGIYNSAIGWQSMLSNTTGSANVSIGQGCMQNALTGNYNVAIGALSAYFAKSGDYNTAIGYQSLYSNTGTENTATGSKALAFNSTGNDNTATGSSALTNNTSGSYNTALGFHSMLSNTTGFDNSAVGRESLSANTTGGDNIAIGSFALASNTTGNSNTATGVQSLVSNTTGSNNTANGNFSLNSNSTGARNSALGAASLYTNTSGYENSAVGYSSMIGNTSGADNTATGFQSLYANTEGNGNTANGVNALLLNSTGSLNTSTGYASMNNMSTGGENTAIGAYADFASANINNSVAIGFNAIVNTSNKVRIGNAGITVIEGQVPFTTPSDGRFKFNVQEDVKGLDFIMQLRPVTYQFDVKRFDAQLHSNRNQKDFKQEASMQASLEKAASIRRTGFIAQEVEQAAIKSGYDFSGIIKPTSESDHYSLSYESFVVPLVKAVQDQQKIIEDLQKEMISLRMSNLQQTETFNALLKRIEQLEKKLDSTGHD